MDVRADAIFGALAPIDEFSLEAAPNRATRFDTLLHCGRPVADVEARILEAQFRLPDGSTLLFLNDDTPFEELLTLLLIGPDLKELDRLVVGGGFTPGYLTTAYPCGPAEVAFCWHDRDQVVTVRRFSRWYGLRSSWLQMRDVEVVPPRPVRADAVTLSDMMRLPRRRVRRGRALPAMVWLVWLSLRTARFRRAGARGRAPRR